MPVEANKELVRSFFDTIEQENYEALKDFCHKDYLFYPDTTVNIAPAYPDIYEEETQLMILRTKEYGAFAVGSGYEAQLKFK